MYYSILQRFTPVTDGAGASPGGRGRGRGRGWG